jgi:hypothetical protein
MRFGSNWRRAVPESTKTRGSNPVERELCWTAFKAVMEASSGETLTVDEIVSRSRTGGARGVSRRTLMREPYRGVVRAQSGEASRGGELAGIPERIRRLGPRGMAERILELEAKVAAGEERAAVGSTASLHAKLAAAMAAA